MSAFYDKVIIQEEDGEKKRVVIFDEKLHVPVIYDIKKCGMDEVLEALNHVK
ncbi:MAG: hypothetical protein ABIR14_02385 [Candidatus Paceibacterota bacterium]